MWQNQMIIGLYWPFVSVGLEDTNEAHGVRVGIVSTLRRRASGC